MLIFQTQFITATKKSEFQYQLFSDVLRGEYPGFSEFQEGVLKV